MLKLTANYRLAGKRRIESIVFVGSSRTNVTAKAYNHFKANRPQWWSVGTYEVLEIKAPQHLTLKAH